MNDHAQLVSGVRQGDLLAGKYRIEKILGSGGMGVVVAARHEQLDHRVAIKFLLPQALANREAVARFAREARAAVKIQSEHVARVSDVGTLDDGAPYMVMEYLEGRDLSEWLGERGPLPVEQAIELLLQVCEAIAEAHGIGIVHRDLKPANLFVIKRADGSLAVKVLDFGISKMVGEGGSSNVTHTSAVMGVAAVHVARAAAFVQGRGRTERHLVARHHPVRAAHGQRALQRRDDGLSGLADCVCAAAAPSGRSPRATHRARRSRLQVPREG